MNEFYEAYIRYKDYLGIDKSALSYDGWMRMPDSDKGVALFVNFYDTISLAKYKVNLKSRTDSDECNAISVLLDRLQRIAVRNLKSDSNMYTPSYIYVFSWTTIGGYARALRNRTLEFHKYNVVSNIQTDSSGQEFNLYDINGGTCTFDDDYLSQKIYEVYMQESDDIKEMIDSAMKKSKIPQRMKSKGRMKHLLDIFEPYFEQIN